MDVNLLQDCKNFDLNSVFILAQMNRKGKVVETTVYILLPTYI